ncbi:MAG: HAMP domain-containing sensor histidine kinase, partial [Chloroflexota bacterium]
GGTHTQRTGQLGVVKLLDNAADRTFDIADISLCQAIANVLANALENAQLYTSLEKRANALQAAYDDLSLGDKIKDDLIQNLSHELQTPLHQVIMQLDLLITDAFGPLNHDQREMMQSTVNRIANLGELIRDMVSLGTLDTMDMRFEEAALDVIVKETIAKLQPKADKVGLQIVPMIEPNLSHVRANKERMAEALEQLIDNAIKFSPRTERKANQIHVRVENTASAMVQVSIQDYGIGIAQSELERIFHSGYQVDGSRTRRFGGTGLGLALVRRIVEGHGGKIWVESEVNAGSRFCFSIPKFEPKSQNIRQR